MANPEEQRSRCENLFFAPQIFLHSTNLYFMVERQEGECFKKKMPMQVSFIHAGIGKTCGYTVGAQPQMHGAKHSPTIPQSSAELLLVHHIEYKEDRV